MQKLKHGQKYGPSARLFNIYAKLSSALPIIRNYGVPHHLGMSVHYNTAVVITSHTINYNNPQINI